MRALPFVAVLALVATQLGGCVAAALVPIAASGAVAKRTIDAQTAGRKVTPVVMVGTGSAIPEPADLPATPEPAVPESSSLEPAFAASLAEPALLAPDPAADGYAAMASFLMAASEKREPGVPRKSALLDQKSLVSLPKMADCTDQRGALVIDLDPGEKPFDLTDPPSPAPGLADYLRTIRGTGTAVLWIATLPESAGKDLATILKATGLDPLGIDRTLLLGRGATRKQQILARADADWCVLAIAGDRRADFDEVFDYLRNPDGPVALALEQHIGAGWFLVPPPIR